MRTDSEEELDRYWARELGAAPGFLGNSPQVRCTVQRLYGGVQLFKRGRQLVLAAPPDRAELVQDKVRGLSVDELFSVDWLQGVFDQDAERILGPAHVYYADSTTFRPDGALAGRPISSVDAGAYRALAAALDSNELEDSGFSGDSFPAFGVFSGGVLCAAASYRVWEPSIAHIIVATHPQYRRRGFAGAAIRSLAADAFDRGLILQWRAVSWNENSLSLARSLGFSHYCSTLYVRLRSSRD